MKNTPARKFTRDTKFYLGSFRDASSFGVEFPQGQQPSASNHSSVLFTIPRFFSPSLRPPETYYHIQRRQVLLGQTGKSKGRKGS
jgi:hypothetical protein